MSSTTHLDRPATTQGRQHRAVRLVRVFAMLGGLSQSLAGSAAALLAREVTGSDAAGGLPQALLVVGAGASALWLARLARAHGRALSLAAGALTAAVGCAAMALGGSVGALPAILVGSLLLGAGNTAVMLSRYAAVELEPGRSAPRAMASVLVATSVGAVIGPNLMQPSGSLVASWDVTPLTGSYLAAAVVYLVGVGIVVRARLDLPPVGARNLPIDGHTGRSPDVATPNGRDGALRRGPSAHTGLGVLVVANLVMVGVMTMAPVHLAHLGGSLWVIGLVVSAHIGAMFGPSALSGWLTERIGAHGTALVSAGVLVVACAVAATAGHSTFSLGVAMVLLGAGWNGCLVSGSDLLTRGLAAGDRPRREGLGEAGMAVAAAVGGATSGLAMARWDYSALALLGGLAASALTTGLVLALVLGRRVRPDDVSRS